MEIAGSGKALTKLKEQAEHNAFKRLQSQFSSPEQLEQIDQHILGNEKRKSTVESQLKSAIQSHFISVNSCMDQLKEVNDNLTEVRTTIYSIQEEYKTISHLENTLSNLRIEATKHKQLKSAKENVKNILNVDDLAVQAHAYIEQNKLLNAHKCLLDMEKCRNDILEELGPPSDKSNNTSDIKLVMDFFKKTKEIQTLLHNCIFVTLKRMLEVSKSFPEQLVTALRIIEREEILDEDWKKKKEETGFAPADRPKKWRKECRDTIKSIAETKIHGCRIEERETDDSWFSKHLGNICSRLIEDLEVVKKLCDPCFPPHYRIFDFFVDCVHQVLGVYLKDLMDTDSLKGQEYFILLSWQDTYKSDYFMGHPNLNLDTSKLPDLLDDVYYHKALVKHIEVTSNKIQFWFSNALDKNYVEWQSNTMPYTIEGNYESSMPNDINTMLIQQLDLINYANDDRFSKETLRFLLNQLSNFVGSLRSKIIEFRTNHFKDTEILKNSFTVRMVSTSNDCLRLKNDFLNIRNKYDKFIDKDEIGGPNDQYEILGSKIYKVSNLCQDSICQDMAKCLDDYYFKILLSKEWLTNDKILVTIIETSKDYMNDLMYLRPESQISVLVKWHNRIKAEYMKGFLQNLSMMTRASGKYKYSDPNERTLFANKLKKEIINLEQWFQNMVPQIEENANLFDFGTLSLMNNIIKADDIDFMGVELGALVKKCPMTSEMLFALLSLRGDISKSEFKEKYEDYCTAESSNDEAMLIVKNSLKI